MKLRWWTRRRSEAAFWKRISETGRNFEREAPFDPELRTRLWERLADEGIVETGRPPTVDSPQSDTSASAEATAAGAVTSQTKLATKLRRAETFAHAVDRDRRSSPRLSDDPELTDAVELVGRLRIAGAVTPRPEFAAELRRLLLEQAAERAATTTPGIPEKSDAPPEREDNDASVTDIRHRQGRRIRLVASTAALILLGGGIGSFAAAQQAMPGDALYGMKRGIENVSTSVSVGDGSQGRRELGHANTRLSEVQALVANGGDVAAINSTFADFATQSRKGISRLVATYVQDGDQASIRAVAAFITNTRQAIVYLAPKLPPESLKPAVEALATIEDLAWQSAAACPKCEKPKPPKNVEPPSIRPGIEPSKKTIPTLPPPQVSGGTTTTPTTEPSPNSPTSKPSAG